MRCVSYTRTVSCLRENEIPSNIISQQNQRIQNFIKKKNWELVRKYSDRKRDEYEEGAFLQMKQDAIGREFDCVVMDSLFRCGRNTNVAAELFRSMFIPAGIYFAVVEDDFCSNEVSTDEAIEYLEEKVKEYRSYTVNVDMRKYTETKQYPKYGYRYKDTGMELVIDPEAAKNVQMIFQLVSEGNSFKDTAEIMTKTGIMSSGKYIDKLWGRTVVNPEEPWKRDQIKRIIYNRLYLGEWTRTINGEKQVVPCPAIIEEELFQKVNNRRDVKSNNLGKTPMNPFSKYIFDKGTGIPLKICTQERLQIRVFRRSYASKENIQYEKGNISYDEVYDSVYKLLLREKMVAEKIVRVMETDEWRYEKEKQLQKVQALAQIIFRRMTESENKNFLLYQDMKVGIISEDEYEKRKRQNVQAFELDDEVLQQYLKQITEIETCFSSANPWLCLFKEMEIPVELKREHIKKWVERIETVRYEYVEIRFKYWEWKERFPSQWLEVKNNGTKK